MSEEMWISRAQSAEAQLKTLREAQGAAIERIKDFKANFGVKERSNGEIVIDYVKFVERLGSEGAADLRKIINDTYGQEVVNVTSKPKRKYVRKAHLAAAH